MQADATSEPEAAARPSVKAAPPPTTTPEYAEWAILPIFQKESFPRKQCIALVDSPTFNNGVLVLIYLNCITMGMFSNPVMSKILSSKFNYNVSTWAVRAHTRAAI